MSEQKVDSAEYTELKCMGCHKTIGYVKSPTPENGNGKIMEASVFSEELMFEALIQGSYCENCFNCIKEIFQQKKIKQG